MAAYTAEENAEMKAHPIGSINDPLPPDRLALRFSVARKIYEKMKTTEWWAQRPDDIKATFEKFPPWKFYTGKDGNIARRSYGVGELTNGAHVLHMATAHI